MPTKIQSEYMKVCDRAERSLELNPNKINYNCEDFSLWNESALQRMTEEWENDLKQSENEQKKLKRKKRRSERGIMKKLQTIIKKHPIKVRIALKLILAIYFNWGDLAQTYQKLKKEIPLLYNDYLHLDASYNIQKIARAAKAKGALTPRDIKKAWRLLSLNAHPDKGGNARRFRILTSAKDMLLNKTLHDDPCLGEWCYYDWKR